MGRRTGKVIGPWALASASYGFPVRGSIRFLGRLLTDAEWSTGLCLINRQGSIRAYREGTDDPAERAQVMRLQGNQDPDLEESIAIHDIMSELSEKAARERQRVG